MPNFCAVNYSDCANRQKDKSKYLFSSTVKSNSKRSLKFSKVRKGTWLAQIFRKDLNSRES